MSDREDITGVRIAGEVVGGMSAGRGAALLDWQARREEREADARVKAALKKAGIRTRRRKTIIDWSAQPLGVESDASIARALGVAPSVVCNARKRLGIPSPTERRRWTRREDKALREHFARWGFGRIAPLAKALGRTRAAVHQRMAVGLRLAPTRIRRRWPKTRNDLVREWGYSTSRIQNAADRLGLVLERGPRDAWLFTREQAEAVREELAKHPDGARLHVRRSGEWGPGETCVGCGRSSVRRAARDRCSRCYRALRGVEAA